MTLSSRMRSCAVVVMGKDQAERLGLPWLAEIGGYGAVADPDPSLLLQPANATLPATGSTSTAAPSPSATRSA
jgi:hypothetical protein